MLSLRAHDERVRQAAVAAARRLLTSTHGLGDEVDPSKVELAVPHVGYSVGLDVVREGELLSAATLYAYRYLLIDDDRAVGSIDVARLGEDRFDVARLGSGPYDQAMLGELRAAREANIGGDQDYEPRFLIIPGMYFCAVWLHGETDDQIVPLLTELKGLEQRRTLPAAEAAQALTTAALLVPTFPGPH